MRTRKMLQIRKVQGEEKKEKHLTTGKVLRAQIERKTKKRKQKTAGLAVKTEKQEGILRKRTKTNTTEVRPRKGLVPKARAKAKRCQKVRRGIRNTADTKKRKHAQEAKRRTMRKKERKKNTMISVGEKGAEVRRRVKGEDLKVMVRVVLKAKIGKNMQSQRVENVSSPKPNTAPTVRPESEAKVETEESEPGPEVKNGIAAEVKITQGTKTRK